MIEVGTDLDRQAYQADAGHPETTFQLLRTPELPYLRPFSVFPHSLLENTWQTKGFEADPGPAQIGDRILGLVEKLGPGNLHR
jgi:hypothetical protein